MSYGVEYLGFGGPIRLLLVPIIARTPQDMLLEKLANKKFCLDLCIILYVKNDVFHKNVKIVLGII